MLYSLSNSNLSSNNNSNPLKLTENSTSSHSSRSSTSSGSSSSSRTSGSSGSSRSSRSSGSSRSSRSSGSSRSSSNSSNNKLSYAIVQNNTNKMITNTFDYQLPVQEEQKVSQFVTYVDEQVMDLGNGNRPTQMINIVVATYKSLREEKMKAMEKGKQNNTKRLKKTAFKGMNLQMIVACIIRCYYFSINRYIPNRILVGFFQNALRRSLVKKNPLLSYSSEQFLKVYEDYLFNPRKYIMNELKKVAPNCYRSSFPTVFQMAQYTSNHFFKFSQKEKLNLRKITLLADKTFGQERSVGDKAIASIFVLLVHSKESIEKYRLLNMTQDKLTKMYESIINQEEIKEIIPEPIKKSYIFSKPVSVSMKVS